MLSEHDLHYLRSILGNLREIRTVAAMPDAEVAALGLEILADNIDWLDCFIDRHEKILQEQST